jgi:hypothetical protein
MMLTTWTHVYHQNKWEPIFNPIFVIGFFYNPPPTFPLPSYLQTAHGLYAVLHLSSFSTVYTTIT